MEQQDFSKKEEKNKMNILYSMNILILDEKKTKNEHFI
jgi:hypothetical protein